MKVLRSVFAETVACSLFSILLLNSSVTAAEFPIATAAKHQQIGLSAALDVTNQRVLVGFLDSVGCPGKECVETPSAQLVSATGALVGAPVSMTPKGGIPSVAFDGTNFSWYGKARMAAPPPFIPSTGSSSTPRGA